MNVFESAVSRLLEAPGDPGEMGPPREPGARAGAAPTGEVPLSVDKVTVVWSDNSTQVIYGQDLIKWMKYLGLVQKAKERAMPTSRGAVFPTTPNDGIDRKHGWVQGKGQKPQQPQQSNMNRKPAGNEVF